MDHARLNRTARGFDRLAGSYDRLVRLVFGRSLERGQLAHVDALAGAEQILILGGGTGWLLEAVLAAHPSAKVCYVELSGKMMVQSQARVARNRPGDMDRVEWVEGTIRETVPEARFDAVLTMFFLDLFEGEALAAEVGAINRRMRGEAVWLLCDFSPVDRGAMRWVSRLLIWTMYRFFRWLCRIPAARLGRFIPELEAQGFREYETQRFYKGMIASTVLKRF